MRNFVGERRCVLERKKPTSRYYPYSEDRPTDRPTDGPSEERSLPPSNSRAFRGRGSVEEWEKRIEEGEGEKKERKKKKKKEKNEDKSREEEEEEEEMAREQMEMMREKVEGGKA